MVMRRGIVAEFGSAHANVIAGLGPPSALGSGITELRLDDDTEFPPMASKLD